MRKIILSVLIFTFSFALDQDAVNLYNQYLKPNYGNKDSIRENIVKPSINVSNFKTLDKSKTFSAPLSCPSQEKAIVISFSQTFGDFTAYIKVDINLDGTFDYFYTTPNISGVCTNGIVSCNPGTWDNCKYYYWEAPNRKPKLIETVDTSKTGTCSCANISCGITTLDQPLFSLIGGGISQAIMKTNSRFLLSKSKWNGNTLELYGQATVDCSSPNFNSYGDTNPTQYYNNQTYPDIDIATVAAQQSNDESSPYAIVSQTSSLEYEQGKQIGMPSIQECVIRKVISNNISTEYENCQTVVWQGQQWCIVGRAKSNGCISGSVSINTPLDILLKPAQSLVAIFTGSYSICDDDSTTGYLKYSGDFTGNYTFHCELKNGKVIYIADSVDKNKNITINLFKQIHSGGGCDFYDIKLLKSSSYKKDNLTISTSNNCPTNCELVDEWVCDKDGNNCIQTVRDGNPLSVSLQKQCLNYTTSLSTYVICSDGNNITVSNQYTGQKVIGSGWFYVKRKYNCGTQNIDVDISRFKNVVESSQIDSSGKIVTYTDLGQTETADLSNIPSESCLTPVCTVKIPKTDTAVFSDNTNRSDTLAGTDSFELEIRTCSKSGSVMTCPVNAGEELVESCKCDIKDQRAGFQAAITSLQILKEASKDIICSSSPP